MLDKGTIDSVLNEIPLIKDIDDAWYVLCKISFIFENIDNNTIISEQEYSFFWKIIDLVFKNDLFCISLEKTLSENKHVKTIENQEKFQLFENQEYMPEEDNDSSINEQKIILLFINIAFFCPTLFLHQLNDSFISTLRWKLISLNRDLEYDMNYQYSYENIIMQLISIIFNHNARFRSKFPLERIWIPKPRQINSIFLFDNHKKITYFSIVTFASLPYLKFISHSLNNKINHWEHLWNELSRLYGCSAVSEKKIEHWLINYLRVSWNDYALNNYILKFRTTNEKTIWYIINRITTWFYFDKDISFDEKLKLKLDEISDIKADIIDYWMKNLMAFNSDLKTVDNEWSNKIFIVTIELISVLEIVSKAKDWWWVRNWAVRSLHIWLEKVNEIINKYELIDDWKEIKDLLKEENDFIEWKTNFFTPTQSLFINEQAEKKKSEDIFAWIIKSIIGMMNTNWWNIIIGVCEHPEKIIRESIIGELIKKNWCVFYNIEHELKQKWMDIDSLKRHIQDKIKIETQLDIDKTNSLWKLIPLEIIDEKNTEKRWIILNISVLKSEKQIYSVERKWNESEWIMLIKLIKRVSWRTIYVDPRDYF